MKRFEYVCTTCGRAFGRRFVAKRHLSNVHKAQGAITSVMDYMLGVVKGIYSWPSLPRNARRPDNVTDSLDNMHKLAQYGRDLQEVRNFRSNMSPSKHDTFPPPTEFAIGYVCKLCCSRGGFALTNLYESPPFEQIHHCKPVQENSFLEGGGQDKLYQKSVEEFPKSFKATIDNWIKGEKFLYAEQIPPEYLQSVSLYLKKYRFKLSDSKFADNTQRHHYLQRAIEEAVRNNFTSIDDSELLDLIRNTMASAAVITINNDESGPHSGSYLVAVVPPHRIAEKKSNDEFIRLMKEFGLWHANPEGVGTCLAEPCKNKFPEY